METSEHQKNRPERGILFAIVLLAFFAVLFGFFRIRQSLYPDRSSQRLANASPSALTASLQEALELQGKDTDADGLNDYDELHRYKTSPYLADSDSDGFSDKQEIDSGHDPNCPSGETCSTGETPLALPPEQPGLSSVLPQEGAVSLPPFTPEGARTILRQGGMTDAQLETVTDDELRGIYEEAAQQFQLPVGGATPPSSSAQYTPDELRALLRSQGIAEELLTTVDDATLMTIFEEATGQ